jgi:hypothetical protein
MKHINMPREQNAVLIIIKARGTVTSLAQGLKAQFNATSKSLSSCGLLTSYCCCAQSQPENRERVCESGP